MSQTLSVYDYPKYYDLIFGSDWKAEADFLQGCFERFGRRRTQLLYEPACGTGRLLFRLTRRGYRVVGADLNPKAVDYCNRRLARHGLPATAVVADMAEYRPPKRVDAAFNTINSFRHLPSEAAAEAHLACVAESLKPGGLYVLGLHLTPQGQPDCQSESWSARRGHLAVTSHMWSIDLDRRRRRERVGMRYDVYTPTRQLRLEDEMIFRTYTLEQFHRLLRKVGRFEVPGTWDFGYEIDRPIEVDAQSEDVVFVLRKG